MKNKTIMRKTDNPKEYKYARREATLSCSICKPHRGENASRKPKHQSKPKKKDKRT